MKPIIKNSLIKLLIQMSSTAKHSAKTIWLVEHSSDNIRLLELILENWGYDTVRMRDKEALETQIGSQPTLPSLIVLNVAPLRNNVLKLVRTFRQHSTLQYVPLLCLCPSGGLGESQIMAAGASNVLNKPFELEELHHKLQLLWGLEASILHSDLRPEMTLLVSETESSSLLLQQHFWSEVFQHHLESNAWEMLKKAGYEIVG